MKRLIILLILCLESVFTIYADSRSVHEQHNFTNVKLWNKDGYVGRINAYVMLLKDVYGEEYLLFQGDQMGNVLPLFLMTEGTSQIKSSKNKIFNLFGLEATNTKVLLSATNKDNVYLLSEVGKVRLIIGLKDGGKTFDWAIALNQDDSNIFNDAIKKAISNGAIVDKSSSDIYDSFLDWLMYL